MSINSPSEEAGRKPELDVIPHPILDVPIDEEALVKEGRLDLVVFGVTAAIAVGVPGLGIRRYRVAGYPHPATPSGG